MSRRPCTVLGCPNTTRRGSGRCPEHRYADRGVPEPGPPPAEAISRAETAESLLRTAFGDDVRIATTTFVSGAIALVLRDGADVVAVLGSSSGDGWGVSVDPSPDDGTARHDAVADSVDGAVAAVVDLLRSRRTGQATDAGRQSGHGR